MSVYTDGDSFQAQEIAERGWRHGRIYAGPGYVFVWSLAVYGRPVDLLFEQQ